jgi:hypothetical protein
MASRYQSIAAGLSLGLLLALPCRGEEKAAATAVNATLGLQLFAAGESVWQEDAATVAGRLGLRRGSDTAGGRFWRSASGTVFGLPGAEVRLLEGANGQPVAIELNLINKGDYFAPRAVRGKLAELYKDEPRKLAKATPDDPNVQRDLGRLFAKDLLACERAAEEALTAVLGGPRAQTFQQAERKRVPRWDWQGAAFLLDARKGEFVMVRILPAAQADERGSSERRTDNAVKQDLAANVASEANGDVWIRNIPMVDQGEKGYCAVATAERILRYYGIAVESHDLADAAGTEKGGGTTWDGMCAAIKRIADRNQRSLRVLGDLSSARAVGRYIDRGIPLIWGLFVTQEIEDLAHRRRDARQGAEPAEWAQRLKVERSATRRTKPDLSGGHLRLIVGYNAKTGEIAYSDSWGDDRIYWLSEHEARLVSFPGTSLAAVVP